MELFKLLKTNDQRNRTCKSGAVKKKNDDSLQFGLTIYEESSSEDLEVTLRQVLERKLTVFKMLYPFLPEDQVQGKVIQSLGIPSHLKLCVRGGRGKDKRISVPPLTLNTLMLKNYYVYHTQLLNSLDHTKGALKVQINSTIQIFEKNSASINLSDPLSCLATDMQPDNCELVAMSTEAERNELFQENEPEVSAVPTVPPPIVQPKEDDVTNQHSAIPLTNILREFELPPLPKRKTNFTIRSIAGNSDNCSEPDSLIVPAFKTKRAEFVCSTPVAKRPTRKDVAQDNESSIDENLENLMLPPTPPRAALARAAKQRPVAPSFGKNKGFGSPVRAAPSKRHLSTPIPRLGQHSYSPKQASPKKRRISTPVPRCDQNMLGDPSSPVRAAPKKRPMLTPLPRFDQNSFVSTPAKIGATPFKHGPLSPLKSSLASENIQDSLVVGNRFYTVKSPVPKFNNIDGLSKFGRKCTVAPSDFNMSGITEQCTQTNNAYDYPEEEEVDEHLGLPVSDYMSKVEDFFNKAQDASFSDESLDEEGEGCE